MSHEIPELFIDGRENNTIPHNATALATELCTVLNRGLRQGMPGLALDDIDRHRRQLQDMVQSCFKKVHGRVKWGQLAVIPASYQFAALQAEREGKENDAAIYRTIANSLIDWATENGVEREALQLDSYRFKELSNLIKRKPLLPSLNIIDKGITWEVFGARYGQHEEHAKVQEPATEPVAPVAAALSREMGAHKEGHAAALEIAADIVAHVNPEPQYSFGQRLMHLRANYKDADFPHGMTEHDLAERLNRQVEAEFQQEQITGEHVRGWERNEQLDMLTRSTELFDALQYVLIDLNDTISEGQKDKSKKDLVQLFDNVKAQLMLPENERNIWIVSAFGRALSDLRSQMQISENDVADLMNAKMKETNHETTICFTVQDIVDFQTGEKDPDERTIARLASVLGDEGSLHAAWKSGKKEGVRQGSVSDQINDLKDRVNREVVSPLEELMDEYGIGYRSNARVHGHLAHLFPEPRGSNFLSARNTMENWLADMRETLTEQRHRLTKGRDVNRDIIDPQIYEPLLQKWQELHEQYLAIRARQTDEQGRLER